MSIFEDKKIEQLDWMTQITETIESKLNGMLAKLPDRVVLDKDALMGFIADSYNLSLSSARVVDTIINIHLDKPNKVSYTSDDKYKLYNCFKFEIEPGTVIDLEKGTLVGGVALVKTKTTLDDHELQAIMGQNGVRYILNNRHNYYDLKRINEVIDLLGTKDNAQLNTRSIKKKIYFITTRLEQIFSTNEWRIRDTELADKVGIWISDYLASGNLAAFTNFCKLKVMTHNERPIYSIIEEEV